MKAEERVFVLHRKMEAARRRREKRKTGTMGAASLSLAACLAVLIFAEGPAHSGGTPGMFSGATMLFENAGGYVLLAVAAFMAGVVTTVLIKRSQRKKKEASEKEQTSEKKDSEEK